MNHEFHTLATRMWEPINDALLEEKSADQIIQAIMPAIAEDVERRRIEHLRQQAYEIEFFDGGSPETFHEADRLRELADGAESELLHKRERGARSIREQC